MERSLATKVLVREVMNGPPVTGKETDTAAELADKMVNLKVGSVVIMDGEEVKGIVTEGDLVSKVVAKNKLPSEVLARDVMSKPLATVESDRDVTTAARLMRKQGIKRLGVTYKGKVVGIISMSDIVSVTPELIDVLSEKARILTGGGRETKQVAGYCDMCGEWSESLSEMDGKFLCEECVGEGGKGRQEQ
jgi:CBS domain-containing protein